MKCEVNFEKHFIFRLHLLLRIRHRPIMFFEPLASEFVAAEHHVIFSNSVFGVILDCSAVVCAQAVHTILYPLISQ